MRSNGDHRNKRTLDQRRQGRLGQRAVLCLVSDRWLQFPIDSELLEDGGHYMLVDVMTAPEGILQDGPRRKLCQLCISKEALLAALRAVNEPEP